MPMCPNCGSYVSEGQHTCQCGTSFSYNSTVTIDGADEAKLADEILKKLARTHKNEAMRLAREGRYTEAIEKCEKSLELDYSIFTLETMAWIYDKAGEYGEAIRCYERMKDGIFSFKAYIGIGKVLGELGKYDEGFENLNISIEKIRQYFKNDEKSQDYWLSRAYNEIGWLYNLQGQYDEAIENYDKGISYCNTYAGNWNCKAIALDSKKKYVEALELYDYALTIDVDDPSIRKNMDECLEAYIDAYIAGEYTKKSRYLPDDVKNMKSRKEERRESDDDEEIPPIIWG